MNRAGIVSASLLFLFLVVLAQCAVIGGMALVSAQERGKAEGEFYRGAYFICWEANQGYGYVESEVIKACNEYVAKERELKAHTEDLPGYAH